MLKMLKENLSLILPGLLILLTGCETVARKEEIITVQEEVAQINAALSTQLNQLRQETDTKLAEHSQEMAKDRATLSEKIESLVTETRDFSGKVDDLDYKLKETLEKVKSEQEGKNTEFRRDLETLKKVQNDLLASLTSLSTSVTAIQNDLLALKNFDLQTSTALEKIVQKIEAKPEPNKELALLKEEFEKKIQILLNEITEQESKLTLLQNKLAGQAEKTKAPEKPKTVKTTVKKGNTTYYIVKSGDYLSRIAKEYGTTVKTLMELNGLTRETIIPGQKLKLPTSQNTSPATGLTGQ